MSDRQLNQLWYHFLRADRAVATSQGRVWGYEWSQAFLAGEARIISFATGASPVRHYEWTLGTDGTRGALFELFAGGQIDLPTPLQGYPLNHETPQAEPFSQIGTDGLEVVVGTQIGERVVDVPGQTTSASELIFAPAQPYYVRVTNLHNQAANIVIGFDVAAITVHVEGL